MIEIIDYTKDFSDEHKLKLLAGFLDTILKDFGKSGHEVNLVICEDEFIQSLNKQYRGIDAPTDVLSFSFEEGESLGDEADEEEGFSGGISSIGRYNNFNG